MLLDPLLQHAQSTPDQPAIVDDRGTVSYRQLAGMSAGLANYLSAQTSKPRVGLLLPTSAGFAVSFFATLLAGKCVVPINFLLSPREIQHIIQDSEIDTIVTIQPLAARLGETGLKLIDLAQLPSPPAAAPLELPSVNSEAIAVLMYTSGTSGLPKGVQLSFSNIESDAHAAIAHAQLKGNHSFLGVLPLFHSTGLLATLIAPITLGSKAVYQARFSPLAMMNAIKEHQISIVAAVPSMYGALIRLKDARPDDMKSIYAAISGGEPLPSAIRDGFEKKFGQPLYEGYGLTETIGPIAFNVPGAIEPGSVGRVIPGAEAKIVNDDGNPVAPGDSGEIWLRGPMIMKGYLHLPTETAEVLTPDGYFKTGDIGFIDSDSYLFITGRKKDLIIIAGEKASPREIEEVILQMEKIAEVAVVGRHDSNRGEAIVAFVIAKPENEIRAEEIRDHCRQSGLPNWKIPKEVHVVTDLPRSPTGKVLKRVLQEQLATMQTASAAPTPSAPERSTANRASI